MSFAAPGKLRGWRKAVVIGTFLLGVAALPLGFLASALGSCPAFAPLDCVPPSLIAQWIAFPGIAVFLIILAIVLRHTVQKEPSS